MTSLLHTSLAPCHFLKRDVSHRSAKVAQGNGPRSTSACVSVISQVHRRQLISERKALITCRAEAGQNLTVQDLISALAKANNAWNTYDKDRNGTMSLKECEAIFNSSEVSGAFQMLTNMSPRKYTLEDLEPYFKRADKDSSGTLSRTEFLALYLAVVGDRMKKNPLLLAEALLGFIDKDKNGVLEGKELKPLLLILGFEPALLMPIPGFMKLNYRAILGSIGSVLEGGEKKAKA